MRPETISVSKFLNTSLYSHCSGLSEAHCSSFCCHCPDSHRLESTQTHLIHNTWLNWYTPAKGEGKTRDHCLILNPPGDPESCSDQTKGSLVFLWGKWAWHHVHHWCYWTVSRIDSTKDSTNTQVFTEKHQDTIWVLCLKRYTQGHGLWSGM